MIIIPIIGIFSYVVIIGVFFALFWRAVKALEASARAQHDIVVALRSIAEKGENSL